MSRFLPLILSVRMIAIGLPFAGALGDDVTPPLASPPSDSVQSRAGPEALEHQGAQNRAADLQQEVSTLQDLTKSIKEQLDQRALLSRAKTLGRSKTVRSRRIADIHRQDSELHGQLQSLIAQLDQQLQSEMQNPPIPDPEGQQQRQAALNAFKAVIADLRQLQDLTEQSQEAAPRDRPATADNAEKHAADNGRSR